MVYRCDRHILQEESHLKVLRLLESNPHLSQRNVATALGVSLGKVNYCIKALLDKGFIKVHNFKNNENKLAYTYLLTSAGIAGKANLASRFLKLKMTEYETLRIEIELLSMESNFLSDKA